MSQLFKSPSTNTAWSIDLLIVLSVLGDTLGCSSVVRARNVYKTDRQLIEFTVEVVSRNETQYFIRSRADAFSYAEIGGPFVVHHHTQPPSNAFIGLNLISVKTYRDVTVKTNICCLF